MRYEQGYALSEDSEIASNLMKLYQDYSGDTVTKPIRMGGGTYCKHLLNAVSFGPACWLECSECHVANEFIRLTQLDTLVRIYADAIIKLACEE